jgi:hypothetical protein
MVTLFESGMSDKCELSILEVYSRESNMYKLMTIVIAVLLISAVAFGADSPISKGSWKIDGSVGFSSTGGDNYESRVSVFSFEPSAGTFVADRLLIGGNLVLISASGDGETLNLWGIGPTIAYYFKSGNAPKDIKGSVYPFVGASFMITGASRGRSSATGTGFAFAGGIKYMITRSVALSAAASYNVSTMESVSTNVFGISAGFSFFIWE